MARIGQAQQTRKRRPARRRRGVALLLVLLSLAILSAIVADFAYTQHVKLTVAARERDALNAHYLARSGVELARMLLYFQDRIQPALDTAQQAGMLPFGEIVFWKLIPLDSEMLCGITGGGLGDALGLDMTMGREALQERREDALAAAPPDVDQAIWSKFDDKSAFCDMGGSFKVEIIDEDSKLSIRKWNSATTRQDENAAIRDQLLALFLPARYDFLFEEEDSHGQRSDRFEVIAALRDWIDSDMNLTDAKAPSERFGRDVGGSEDSSYDTLDPPYKAKNAYFDSQQELHLVRGFDDEMYDTFADALSIYSEGKVNIKSATNPTVLLGLINACALNPNDIMLSDHNWLVRTLMGWNEYRQQGMQGGFGPVSAQGFVGFLQTQLLQVDETKCLGLIGEQSMVFTIKSTGKVGEVERTITTVMRIYRSYEDMYYWREE